MESANSSVPTVWTFDWVPDGPRGFVRDLRLRWACEEAGLDYQVRSVPFEDRGADHLAHQPFGQVPFLTDGDLRLFESGACLLHLAEKSEILMPQDAAEKADTLSWVIAALNSVEMVSLPWWFVGLSNPPENPLEDWLRSRLDVLEGVFAARDWLAAGRFTAADLIMADVVRLPWVRGLGSYPATDAYVARICARPAFEKAHADQMAHFAAADVARAGET
ncbi:glutathione S-transferase family protein [Primorskyibacter flagellatus]|uniref:Glutathione S-transferase n=1 Tax=Primorskyibacter flagellatus TaxID=1387277 RepID=A0A1W2DP75_9RHOB|nr:glutathione S-transferase family protein [Primorskyibacter flagellatus]SMC99193.1 glutathione S-transferase [Primorskyibacter flagellatus]